MSSTGRNGLRTKSSAPASKARTISSWASSAVDPQHLVAVGRRHHQVEQDDRRVDLLDGGERLGAAPDRDVTQARRRERLHEDVPAHGVVIDDQYGPVGHTAESTVRTV
jgi:hypothetical protein